MAKKAKRVHVDCVTPGGYRTFLSLVRGGSPPIGERGADGSITVLRPDRFARVLEATGCRVTETLKGSRRRR